MKQKQEPTAYQPKTGATCGCKRGVQRDNCPNCEGTGMVIDFGAIRARSCSHAIVTVPANGQGSYCERCGETLS